MIGEGAQSTQRDSLRLDVVAGRDVPENVIEDLVRTEQACCPFFRLQWRPGERRLSIAVADIADKPALELIAGALGIENA